MSRHAPEPPRRSGSGPSPTPARLRIVTANLANRRADPRAFAEWVASVEPDAVAVQELWPEQADALGAVMPHGRLFPRRDYDGMGIALRRPGEVRALPLRYRGALVTDLGPDPAANGASSSIEIVNVHILAPHAPPLGSAVGHRRGQVEGLLAHLATGARPRALVGDLNSTWLFPAYWRLRRRLEDAALAVARRRGQRPPSTWRPLYRGAAVLRIDHALVEGVTVLDCQVAPVLGSDHHALVLDLSPAGPPSPHA